MMITKRQFLVTILLFLILLLLFMGFQISKNSVNSSGENRFAATAVTKGLAVRKNSGFTAPDDLKASDTGEEWVLFVGSEDSRLAGTVREWAYYTGVTAVCAQELPAGADAALPGVVMIEPGRVAGNAERLAELMDAGVDVIFLSLPDYDSIAADDTLREILGIHRLVQPETTLSGIHLFSGFLLGGERIFDPASDADQNAAARQDLELVIPWYAVRGGTTTFMRGILSADGQRLAAKDGLEAEDMPAVVWKSSYGAGEAYAVNGSYMENRRIGLGMLQAMMHQRSRYLLYPVVNAQVFSVANFPILTDENQEKVEGLYGRTATKTQTDIVMPMFITMGTKYDVRPSCFLSVKYDDRDPAGPRTDLLKGYLSMLGEMNGELAWSAVRKGTAQSAEKAGSDRAYLQSEAGEYRITAALASPKDAENLPGTLAAAGFDDIRTIATAGYSDEHPIIGYLDGDITCQQATTGLTEHTYMNDLELLGVQTMLAYDNAFFDLSAMYYPEDAADEWQNLSRTVFSNLTTYRHPFNAEDHLTVTGSDARVRAYLSLGYTESRTDDRISLTLDSFDGTDAFYFILRTHNEKLISVSGGSFEKLEDDAYLISAEQTQVEIRLASALSSLLDMEGRNR